MTGYIYNVDTSEIIVVIEGSESNDQIEAKAADMGYSYSDEYALTYTRNGLIETTSTEYVEAG